MQNVLGLLTFYKRGGACVCEIAVAILLAVGHSLNSQLD